MAVDELKEAGQVMGGGGGFNISKLSDIHGITSFGVGPVIHKIFTNKARDGGDRDWPEVTEGLWTGSFADGRDVRCLPVREARVLGKRGVYYGA